MPFLGEATARCVCGTTRALTNTAFLSGGVEMERWLAFRRDEPEAFAAFMVLGRDRIKFFENPFVAERRSIVPGTASCGLQRS
jgi:hypothetical protein